MPEEKTIERWEVGLNNRHRPNAWLRTSGPFVKYEDHLAALGEAEKERGDELCRCIECGHLQAEPNWCHRCGHRTSQPPWAKRLLGELEAAKDEQEAAEKELAGLRADIAYVRDWRDALEIVDPSPEQCSMLLTALREDAEKLGGGG